MNGIDVLLVQFLAHLLGDFYFQSERSCSQKEHKDGAARSGALGANVRHVLVIWFFAALGFLAIGLMQSGNSRYYGLAFQASIVLAILHLSIDLIKSGLLFSRVRRWLVKRGETEGEANSASTGKATLFFYDQIAHMVTIIAVLYIVFRKDEWSLKTSGFTPWIAYGLAILFICKPANVLIKQILDAFKINPVKPKPVNGSDSSENESAVLNAGRLIGACERILLLLLLVKGLYTEAGLVLGAKSILRYESTGRNEYVLVGTLLSVMVVVTVYVLLEQAGFAAF